MCAMLDVSYENKALGLALTLHRLVMIAYIHCEIKDGFLYVLWKQQNYSWQGALATVVGDSIMFFHVFGHLILYFPRFIPIFLYTLVLRNLKCQWKLSLKISPKAVLCCFIIYSLYYGRLWHQSIITSQLWPRARLPQNRFLVPFSSPWVSEFDWLSRAVCVLSVRHQSESSVVTLRSAGQLCFWTFPGCLLEQPLGWQE